MPRLFIVMFYAHSIHYLQSTEGRVNIINKVSIKRTKTLEKGRRIYHTRAMHIPVSLFYYED